MLGASCSSLFAVLQSWNQRLSVHFFGASFNPTSLTTHQSKDTNRVISSFCSHSPPSTKTTVWQLQMFITQKQIQTRERLKFSFDGASLPLIRMLAYPIAAESKKWLFNWMPQCLRFTQCLKLNLLWSIVAVEVFSLRTAILETAANVLWLLGNNLVNKRLISLTVASKRSKPKNDTSVSEQPRLPLAMVCPATPCQSLNYCYLKLPNVWALHLLVGNS